MLATLAVAMSENVEFRFTLMPGITPTPIPNKLAPSAVVVLSPFTTLVAPFEPNCSGS